MVYLNANTAIFLPGQLAFKDGFGHDFYVVLAATNFIMGAGQQVTPIMYGDGGHCIATIGRRGSRTMRNRQALIA